MSAAKSSQQILDYDTALALLKNDRSIANRRFAIFVVGGISSVVIMMVACARITEFFWWPYLFSFVLAVAGLAAFVRTLPRLPEDVTLRDTRLIGPVLDNLSGAMEERRANLKCWLCELLPLMRERDADALTQRQRVLLIEELFAGEPTANEAFKFVVLNALKNVADVRALTKARWLAEAGSGYGYSPEVCAVAREVASHLEALLAERGKRAGLLLPSSAAEIGNAELVRASAPQATATDASQLLRTGASPFDAPE